MINRYKETYLFPFNSSIPNYLDRYKRSINSKKRILKFFKRYLYLFIKRQISLECLFINKSVNKILWINLSAPSLGDSIMDLSSRTMIDFAEIDLFTDKKNEELYKKDPVFRRVFSSISSMPSDKYDLVILDSYSTRTVKIKSLISPKTRFVSMFAFYNGPEVNRVLFSFHRMNHLLGNLFSVSKLNQIAKPTLGIQGVTLSRDLPIDYIAIVIGGEWGYRTYDKWKEVVEFILNTYQSKNIVLVGSLNGEDEARKISCSINSNRIFNFVNQFTFIETVKILEGSNFVLCCDGGLMHASNCLQKPIIPLFAKLTPKMQLTESIPAFPCYDAESVVNIKVSCIKKNIKKIMNVGHIYHLDE